MGKDTEETYSVLMAVYEKDNPVYFRQSIQSMLDQTLPPSDFVIVCDGPLTPELDKVLEWAGGKLGKKLQCIRLKENRGLGNALRTGVPRCRCAVIARMDSDDVSRRDRCERQFQILNQGDYGIVSGTLQEFIKNPGDLDRTRVLPRTPEEIREYAKKRNPFNHPCVMYRKADVLKAGNYQDFPGFEDYCLWIRMLCCGVQGYNIQEPVLDMRSGNGMYQRRGGLSYLVWILRFQKFLLDRNFITKGRYIRNCVIRTAVSLIPGGLRERFYELFLRGTNKNRNV